MAKKKAVGSHSVPFPPEPKFELAPDDGKGNKGEPALGDLKAVLKSWYDQHGNLDVSPKEVVAILEKDGWSIGKNTKTYISAAKNMLGKSLGVPTGRGGKESPPRSMGPNEAAVVQKQSAASFEQAIKVASTLNPIAEQLGGLSEVEELLGKIKDLGSIDNALQVVKFMKVAKGEVDADEE